MFKFRAYGVELKDDSIPMPYLQYSKAETINDITDNGRIIAADYVEIWLNEIDLKIIDQQYNIKKCLSIGRIVTFLCHNCKNKKKTTEKSVVFC